MHRGYIKWWRKSAENPLWTAERFTRGQAWVDLIMLANHKDGEIRVRGIPVPVPRGVCGWSVVSLSERWQWSRGKTTRFLNELEMRQQIEQQKSRVTSLIKIVNYDQYQSNDTTKQTTDGQQTDTNKNDKNDKKYIFRFEREVPLPKNFTLTDDMIQYAKDKNYTGDIKAWHEQMILSAGAKNYKYKDWHKAWKKWFCKHLERNPSLVEKKKKYVA